MLIETNRAGAPFPHCGAAHGASGGPRLPPEVRPALSDHDGERARAPKRRERRRAPPPAPWRGAVVHDAAPSMLYHASPRTVAEPTAARTGAEWLPDRARQAQSPSRSKRESSRRRSPQPSAVRRPPSAVHRPPSAITRFARRARAVWTRAAQRRTCRSRSGARAGGQRL